MLTNFYFILTKENQNVPKIVVTFLTESYTYRFSQFLEKEVNKLKCNISKAVESKGFNFRLTSLTNKQSNVQNINMCSSIVENMAQVLSCRPVYVNDMKC